MIRVGEMTSARRSAMPYLADFVPWGRAIISIYLTTSISYRFVFLPSFQLSLREFPGFIVLDFLSTVFFSYETIQSVKQTRSLLSQTSILPDKFDPPVGDSNDPNLEIIIDESVERRLRRSFWSYVRVICEIICTLPLEYLSFFTWGNNLTNYMMLNRLLRTVYLWYYITDLSTLMLQKGIIINIGVRRTCMLFFLMAYAGHFCGIGFYYYAYQDALKGYTLTWPEVMGLYSVTNVLHCKVIGQSCAVGKTDVEVGMNVTLAEAYISSVYWAWITMITTGLGDLIPMHIRETVASIVTMFIGFIITALTVANLQMAIGKFDEARLAFQQKMGMIKKFLRYRGLPKIVQERVVDFYDYQWRMLQGADEEQFLKELPRSLQQQVTNIMCRDIIHALPLLKKANTALLNALVECAEMNIHSPNEEIVKHGDNIRGVFLVAQGEVEILRDGIVQSKMQRLDFYAQECLFVDKIAHESVRSKGFSEVIVIPRTEFQAIILSQCDKEYIAQLKDTATATSKTITKANKMMGSGVDITPTDGFKKHCHPNSFFRKVWSCLVLLALVLYTFVIPLSFMHLVENTPFGSTPAMLCLGYLVDAFFWADAILSWNYFFYLEGGLVVFDTGRIRQKFYQDHNFVWLFIGLFPFDLASCFLGGRFCHYFRLVKLVHLSRIFMYLESVDTMLTELRMEIDLCVYRIAKLNVLMIVIVHWVGCLYYMMGSLSIVLGYTAGSGFSSRNWRLADETHPLHFINHADLGGIGGYLRASYFSLVALSTVGYGDMAPKNIVEISFVGVFGLIGGLILPAVIGGISVYILNFGMLAKSFRKRVTKVRLFLRRIGIGEEVLDKVSRYYDYYWSCQGGMVEQDVIDELPDSLRNAVSSYISGNLIDSVPFLRSCDEATRQLVSSALSPHVFLPNDCILREGERGFEMYFLKRGQAVVTSSSTNVPLKVLSTSDFFGERCLFGSAVSGATVKASTYCECFSLSRDDLMDALALSSSVEHVKVDFATYVWQANTTNQKAIQNFSDHPKCRRLAMETVSESIPPAKTSVSFVFLPQSAFLLIWNTLLLFICVYNAWTIPFRIAFLTVSDGWSLWIDWIFDALFLLDMVLHYRFIAYVHEGELVTDTQTIKYNYMTKRFKLDLVSTLPFDIAAHYILPGVPIIGDTLRLLKMIRFGSHFGTLAHIFSFLEDNHISTEGFRLVEFLAGVVLISHWACCGFFLFAKWKNNHADCAGIAASTDMWNTAIYPTLPSELGECLWDETWIMKQIRQFKLPLDGGSAWQQYLRSFNWAFPTLTVVSIGDSTPTTVPETLYVFIVITLGVTVNAAIVGNVCNILANLDSDSSVFNKQVDEIRNYMFKHRLSPSLHSRVDEFTRNLWLAHNGNSHEDDFILSLPNTLQTDVLAHTRTKLLLDCPFFDSVSIDIVKALALIMMPLAFSAGEVICGAGEFGQSMYFLESGTAQVVSSDSTVVATLREGSFFGETSLFTKQPRTSSVCAITFCDIFELGKQDVFAELSRRNIDIGQMVKSFSTIHDKNARMNKAIQTNLLACKQDNTKLGKLIGPSDGSNEDKETVMTIFMPGSHFSFCFDIINLALILYFSVFVLYRIAFRPEGDEARVVIFDMIADAFFIIDMYLRSSHFAFVSLEYGSCSLITDRRSIFRQYLKSGIIIDFLSSISVLEVFFPRLQLRSLSLLRLLRLPLFVKKINDHLALRGVRISLATTLVANVILLFIIANHWIACIWFIIFRYIERNEEITWATADCPWDDPIGTQGCIATWNETEGQHSVCDLEMIDCYVRSLHFTITTLSTVGFGDIIPLRELETIFEQFVVLAGACFLAGLISVFAEYLGECDRIGVNAFDQKIQNLKKYLQYRNIPEDIQASILFFHNCRWKDSQTLDERETLRLLPEPLQLDIAFAVKQRVIKLVPILDALPNTIQKRLAHAMILQVFSSRDHPIIYSQGDIGWEIYFIASGVVSIGLPSDFNDLDATGRENFAMNRQKYDSIGLILGAGSHVGESCLISESGVRQETVTAKTLKVELYVLNKDDLNDICKLMGPEKGRGLIQALLSRNLRSWHTFDEIEGIGSNWEEEERVERVLLARRSSILLPWNVASPNKSRRKSSVALSREERRSREERISGT